MYGENSQNDAEKTAKFIEDFLGNSLSRKTLGFCTAECKKCGRRIENALKEYAGEKKKLCIKCRLSSVMISKALDLMALKMNVKKQDILTALKDPMWVKGVCSVLEGIALFGMKKPFTASRPFLVVWNITKACNLRCKHCYEDAHVVGEDELSTEEALNAVDKLGDAGIAYVAVSGGEPLLRKDLWQVIDRIRKNEMAFSIATNATLLSRETAKKLKELNCQFVQVSLDGATAKKHDFLRGKGAFEKTIVGIKNAVAEGLLVGTSMTVTRHNLSEVPKVINLSEKLGAKIFMHYNFIPTGRGKEIVKLDITPQQREKLLSFLSKESGKKRKISLLSTAPQYARVCCENSITPSLTHFDTFCQDATMQTDVSFLADFVGGCGTGRLYFALDYNGNMTPCVFIPISLGNIKNIDIVKMWKKDEVLHKIRERKKFTGNCSSCKYSASCGGCRARSLGYYSDLTHSDPGCILNQREWKKLEK